MGEAILGSFVIEKFYLLRMNVTYRLLFTFDRLIAAKFKSVKEALFIENSGRVLVGLIEILRKEQRISEIPGLVEMDGKLVLDPQVVLSADEDNFELLYSQITEVKMKKGGFSVSHGARAGKMIISTYKKKQGFEIIYRQKYEDCVNVVYSVLPNKLIDQSKLFTRYCPICRDEFQAWVDVCPDCGVELVKELLPSSPMWEKGNEPLVCVAKAPNEAVANIWEGILAEHGIRCYLKSPELKAAAYVLPSIQQYEIHVFALEADRAWQILAPFIEEQH